MTIPQYSFAKVVGVWAAAALPMGLLGWVANPWLARSIDGASGIHGTARLLLLTVGLVWQFVLTLILVRRESPALAWSVLRERLWLGAPKNPRTGRPDARLWFWLALLVPLFGLSVFVIAPALDGVWLTAFPSLAEPAEYSVASLLEGPGSRALEGAWWFFGLFLLLAVFNTVLGEELLFRGLLLPRMQGAFGRWDWLANGVLFGIYHVHQPWGLPSSVLDGVLLFALPTKLWRCAWVGIAVHSAQSAFFALVLLPAFVKSA